MPTAQELLRALASQGPAAADALDNIPDLEATITGLETTRDQLTADLAEARRQLEERPVPADGPVLLNGAPTLDSFPGKTWDDKMTAALGYVGAVRGAKTVTPPILMPTDRVDLTKPIRLFDGLKLIYPYGVGSIQRAAESIPCDVRYTGTAPLFYLDQPTVFDVQMQGISFQSNNGGQFIDTGNGVVWTSVFRDLGFNGWRNGFGSPSKQFLNTACLFDGWWNVNNCRGTFATFGGSDTEFAWSRFLIGVGGNATYKAEFAAAKAWLLDFAWQQKGRVTGIYATVEGAANGVRVHNPDTGGPLTFESPILEGRNAGAPTTGVTFQIDSGVVVVNGGWMSYGNRATTDRSGAPVVVAGGDVTFNDPHYNRATARAATDPWAHQSGGRLTINRAHSPEPVRVKRAGGVLTHDASVVEV